MHGIFKDMFQRFHEYKENKEFFIMIFRVMIHARTTNQKKKRERIFY